MFARAPVIVQTKDESEVKEWNPDIGFVKVTRFTKGVKNNQKARREEIINGAKLFQSHKEETEDEDANKEEDLHLKNKNKKYDVEEC